MSHTGIRVTGQKELLYGLHHFLLNKYPVGYSEETEEFVYDQVQATMAVVDWSEWSPILPMCILAGTKEKPSSTWDEICIAQNDNNDRKRAALASYLHQLCQFSGATKVGLRGFRKTIQLTEYGTLLIAGAPVLHSIMSQPPLVLNSGDETVSVCSFLWFICSWLICLVPDLRFFLLLFVLFSGS
jgi:hypothetical protein